MESQAVEKKEKGDFFKNLKIEFKKVIWPTPKSAAKQTIAVVVCTIILGIIAAALDTGIQALLSLIS